MGRSLSRACRIGSKRVWKNKTKIYGLKTVLRPFWAKKFFPFKMKKNLENFHEILSVSKHSHSEVGFILVISLGPEGVGSFADRKGVGGHRPPAGGGALAAHGGHQKPPLSCQHWVWEGWWSGTITKMVKGIDSWEFPKEQSLVEDKPESGTQKYSKCQTPPHMKKTSCF